MRIFIHALKVQKFENFITPKNNMHMGVFQNNLIIQFILVEQLNEGLEGIAVNKAQKLEIFFKKNSMKTKDEEKLSNI